MTAITKQQREYALSRINQIFAAKEKLVRDEFYEERKSLTPDEAWELIKSGEVHLKESKPDRYTGSWRSAFDFTGYEHEGRWKPGGKEKLVELQAKKIEAQDSLMLGDAQEALEIIKQFT